MNEYFTDGDYYNKKTTISCGTCSKVNCPGGAGSINKKCLVEGKCKVRGYDNLRPVMMHYQYLYWAPVAMLSDHLFEI